MSKEQRLNGAGGKRVKQAWDNLSDIHEKLDVLEAAYDELSDKNTKLKKALVFYADEKNWAGKPYGYEFLSAIDHDNGEVAQKALEI